MKAIIALIAACALSIGANAGITLNPDVHQDTIRQTICQSGYTKAVRPSTTYTNGVKRKLLRES